MSLIVITLCTNFTSFMSYGSRTICNHKNYNFIRKAVAQCWKILLTKGYQEFSYSTESLTRDIYTIKVWLQYLLAMQKLAIEAQNKAKEEKKNIIHSDHIRAVSKKVLQSCKG